MIKKRTPRHQKTLKTINDREKDRLGSSSVVNTKSFRQRQKFGPASEVKRINPDDLTPEELERLGITFSAKRQYVPDCSKRYGRYITDDITLNPRIPLSES